MTEPPSKVSKMESELDQLKEHTVVVADTGDFEGKLVGRGARWGHGDK